MKFLRLVLTGMLVLSNARGDDFPFRVANPSDSKNEINEDVRRLIAHLQEPKPPDFISAPEATKNLKWRVERMTVITGDVVAVVFTEGHIDVIGIFARNPRDRAWELKAAIGGSITVQSFSDDSLNTKKTKG